MQFQLRKTPRLTQPKCSSDIGISIKEACWADISSTELPVADCGRETELLGFGAIAALFCLLECEYSEATAERTHLQTVKSQS